MKDRLITVVLTIGICIGIYFAFLNTSDDSQLKLLEKEKQELIKEKASIIKERDSISKAKSKVSDSLRREEQNIKYIPYEKIIYYNRTLDDALIILSNYKYDRPTEKDN